MWCMQILFKCMDANQGIWHLIKQLKTGKKICFKVGVPYRVSMPAFLTFYWASLGSIESKNRIVEHRCFFVLTKERHPFSQHVSIRSVLWNYLFSKGITPIHFFQAWLFMILIVWMSTGAFLLLSPPNGICRTTTGWSRIRSSPPYCTKRCHLQRLKGGESAWNPYGKCSGAIQLDPRASHAQLSSPVKIEDNGSILFQVAKAALWNQMLRATSSGIDCCSRVSWQDCWHLFQVWFHEVVL